MRSLDDLRVVAAPAGAKPQRLVQVFQNGTELFRDSLDPCSARSRKAFVREVADLLQVDHAKLVGLDRQIVTAADAADEALDSELSAGDSNKGRKSQATQLVELAIGADLFHDQDGNGFARVSTCGHSETLRISAKPFRRWLARLFYEVHGSVPGSQAVQDALQILEGKATFERDQRVVALRVGGDLDRIVVDLGDEAWRCVVVDSTGWQVVDNAPVLFRRPKGAQGLPVPQRGADLHDLRRFVNISDEHYPLLVAWLLASLRPIGPYPLLVVTGEQGSAKSTTARLLRRLVDPNIAELRSAPRNERDLVIGCNSNWILNLENLSCIPDWLSDCLCRLSTGGAFATRELFSDSDETVFNGQRPAIANGIEELATRSDLLDRSLLITLPRIPEDKRRTEAEFWRDFEVARPALFGALLDCASAAIRNIGSVHLDCLPRLADFACWIAAAEVQLGWTPGYFLQTYAANRQGANDSVLESNHIGEAVLRFVHEVGSWQGKSGDLLKALNARIPDEQRKAWTRDKAWPESGRGLSGQLRRIAPNLRGAGLEVVFDLPDRELRIARTDLQSTAATAGTAASQDNLHGAPARTPPFSTAATVATAGTDLFSDGSDGWNGSKHDCSNGQHSTDSGADYGSDGSNGSLQRNSNGRFSTDSVRCNRCGLAMAPAPHVVGGFRNWDCTCGHTQPRRVEASMLGN